MTTLPGTVGGEVPDGSGGGVIDPGTGLVLVPVDPGQSGCDPETGICGGDTSGNGQVAVGGGGGGLPQGAQVATVVAKSAGSGPSLALVVLVVLMLLAVVLAPALAWRRLSRGGAA